MTIPKLPKLLDGSGVRDVQDLTRRVAEWVSGAQDVLRALREASGTAVASGPSLASEITNDSGVSGTTVADALDTLALGVPPSGAAGGDLTGTYPNPTIAALAVTDAKVATANKDGTTSTPSMRTLGTGATQACAGNDSRLSDSRAPSGSAGGDLGGTYPNPNVAAIHETSGPTQLTIASVPDGQFLRRSGSSVVGATVSSASAIPSERWAKPISAHADDVEFDTTSLSAFTLYDGSGNAVSSQPADTTIDPYTNDTTNHHADANTYKPDWLSFKCRNNNSRFYYMKAFTAATNVCCYTRVALKARSPSPADNECDIGFMLMGATSGHPDPNNRIEYILQQMSGGRRFVARVTNGGSDTTVNTSTQFDANLMQDSYLIIHKIGTTIHFWLSEEGASRVYTGNTTFSGTIAYVGFLFQTNSGTPGNGPNHADFIRFVNSATYLP